MILAMNVLRHIRTMCILAIIAGCAFAPSQSRAQSPELGTAFKEYQKLNKQGKYVEAMPFAKKSVELTKSEFGIEHRFYGSGLNNLANIYSETKQVEKAIGHYKLALEADPTNVASLFNLGLDGGITIVHYGRIYR